MMKLSKKIALITGVIMIVAGVIVSVCAMAALGFDFTKLNNASFSEKTYSISEPFTDISVDGAECDIRLLPSDDGECRVECNESEKISHTVTVENGKLTVKRHDDREWYEHIGIYFSRMQVVIYLPESEYGSLYAKNLSGDIVIPDDFAFDSAEVISTSGDVTFYADVSDDLSVKTVSGDLYVKNAAPESMKVQSTSGDITVKDVRAGAEIAAKSVSGDIEFSGVTANEAISAESTSGDIELEGCDAERLKLKSTSGDISGTLLSEKTFVTKTTSGGVRVPNGSSGGECEVRTTSGDIEFRID